MGRMSDMPSVDSPPEGALVRARTSFLVDDRVDDGSVRDIILASWTRSREWNIDVDGAELSAFDTESDSQLVRAARPVLDSRHRRARGRARERHPHRRRRGRAGAAHGRLVAVAGAWTGSGWPPASATRRSSSAPTASAPLWRAAARPRCSGTSTTSSRSPQFACAGAPVWHPVSGKLLGVIDLTCWRQDAGRFMSTAVARIARQIETALHGPVGAPRAGAAARLPHRLPTQQHGGVRASAPTSS